MDGNSKARKSSNQWRWKATKQKRQEAFDEDRVIIPWNRKKRKEIRAALKQMLGKDRYQRAMGDKGPITEELYIYNLRF